MSDTMLHGILQMPPELWTNDAIDIAQRHGRYLEASKRIMVLERERDEARRERDELRKNYLALAEEWKKSVFRLANERDEARRERDEAKSIISRLVSRRIISWGDVDSVLEAINEEEEEA